MIEALTELASKSTEATSLLETKSLLDPLKSGLTSTDILTRFNILEILAEFGTTLSGSEFLDHSGVLARIAQVVENEAGQDSLGLNAIVKLYGKLGAAEQVDFVSLDMKYQILGQLERLLVGDDEYEPDESSKVINYLSIFLHMCCCFFQACNAQPPVMNHILTRNRIPFE
jgi:hypothetical protein